MVKLTDKYYLLFIKHSLSYSKIAIVTHEYFSVKAMMTLEWMLQKEEISTTFNDALWIPLKALKHEESGNVEKIGYHGDFFSCSTIAFFSTKRIIAEYLDWREIGCWHEVLPSIDDNGHYSFIEHFEMKDEGAIGIHLVFDYPQSIVEGRRWGLNPDLVIALGLVKAGNCWVRSEEGNVVVAREVFDKNGDHVLIEIKREFLLDYLAARALDLRIYYCSQRAENIAIHSMYQSEYKYQESRVEQTNGGEFELTIRKLDDVFNGRWILYQPDDHIEKEVQGNDGVRIDSSFRKDEWIEHQNKSMRIQGDV